MKRPVKGLALLLFGILLAVCFPTENDRYFHFAFFGIPFASVYLLIGIAGLARAFWPERPEK